VSFGVVSNRSWFKTGLKSAGNRLRIALAAALCVHLIFMIVTHWAIHLNTIPSDTQRVLTLTLENSHSEGLFDAEHVAEETQNDVPLGDVSDVEVRDNRDELVAAEVLNPLGEPLPSPEFADVSEVGEVVAEMTMPQSASPAGKDNASDLQSTSLPSTSYTEALSNPSLSDTPLLASNVGALAISTEKGLPELQVAQKVSVTESEQRMLDQKIKHWSETLDSAEDLTQSVTWQELGQTYTASFSKRPASGDMDLDQVIVEVRTEKDGEQLTTELRMKKLAFSNFGQFVHRWDPNISMHDDAMSGRFHSNTRFNLEYSRRAKPKFNDKVTTASYRVDLSGPTSKKKIFLGGLETGVKRILMPKPKMLFPEVETGEADSQREHTVFIGSDSRLFFQQQGTVLIQSLKEASPMREIELGESPVYLMASPNAVLHVSGVVNGVVAVYSPKRIVIEGDLTYRSFDDVNQGGDFIGLVSGRNVVVARRKVTGPGDLTVHAAIYAKSRFKISDRTGRREGTLIVKGSVSAGTLSATEPRYATNITFDKRFENVRPPGFPVTDRYEVAAEVNGWTRALPVGNEPIEGVDQQDSDWSMLEITQPQ